ncbi:single-stranded DNA-binding protein [Actinokineospora bangkokensis]|uniref:Single-stranded DNA-binding protein n=1 Tax=Actinokineospora bangkokensis TaxID=1193682 RepID=A0A1Q9LC04_9PSEU|nr:single-stranded DNA-binding protein [Actinokineospora bangkokensis]OLR89561.1 hypothetical protein BJP25_05660 [Actinokineospora bangkokensis]
MNETMVTLTGWVVAPVEQRRYEEGKTLSRFRMVSKERRYDADTAAWVDGHQFYCEVQCWDRFGENVAAGLGRGDPVVVHGRLRVEEYEWEGAQRTTLVVRASAVGRNLRFPRPADAEPIGADAAADAA